MKTALNVTRLAVAAIIGGSLFGCGGGGGGGATPASSSSLSPTPTPAPTPSPTPSPSSQYSDVVASTPTPTYPPDDGNNADLGVFTKINQIRAAMGTGRLAQNAQLDTAAQAHWSYVNQNGVSENHSETSGNPGFTGATPGDRATAAGYSYSNLSEVMVAYGTSVSADRCAGEWENSVYHTAVYFLGFYDIGIAAHTLTQGALSGFAECVVDFGVQSSSLSYGQLPADGTVTVLPYDGETGVTPAFNNQAEIPTPAPDLNGAGHPIGISFATKTHPFPTVIISALTVTPAGGSPIAIRLLSSTAQSGSGSVTITNDANVYTGMVFALPTSALTANMSYTVSVSGTVDGASTTKTWSFITGT